MLNRLTLSGLIALALSAGAAAHVPAEPPVFIEGGQYTAVLDQSSHHWRLLPGDGVDLNVRSEGACKSGPRLPQGIWLLTRDEAGRPALLAPSITALPQGFPEQVALRPCGEAADGAPYVAAPQGLIDWLSYNTGAIFIED